MGTDSETASFEEQPESRADEKLGNPVSTALTLPGVEPFVDRLLERSLPQPDNSPIRSLSGTSLKIPLLQRAQRLYGNRASQQIVMGARVIQRQCACGGACPKCQEEEQQRMLQRKSSGSGSREFDGIPSTQGEPIEANIRPALEAHFQTDLSDVRVHAGSEAAASSSSLDALAYTSGRDIYFAAGMYAPSSSSGRRLLAHETAHVIQQSSGKEPAIATKSAHGMKIGAPDDPLESEADRQAEFFVNGTPGELTEEERRRRQESGLGQTVIQRQVAPDSSGPPAPPAPAPSAQTAAGSPPPTAPQAPPVAKGEIVKTLDGVELVEDPVFMRYQLEQLVAQGWGDSHYRFLMRLEHDVEIDEMAGDRAFKKQYEENPSVPAGVPRSQEDFDAYDQMKEKERRVLEIVRPIATALDEERNRVISDFEKLAKDRAHATLEESEKQEKSEAARYGIKWEVVERTTADCLAGDCKYTQTTFTMGEQSPAVTGLQGAAQLLLNRRNEVNQARDQLEQARLDSLSSLASCAGEGAGSYAMECPGSEDLGKRREAAEENYKKKKDSYDLMRGYLSDQYPVLAVFSDPEKSDSDLKSLSTQKAGPEMAALVGREIVDRLTNIAKVRNGLEDSGEVNVWRLPSLTQVTRELMGVNAKPVWKKWIDEKTEREQPGIFWSIALAVLNLGAIIAAPFTGGLSLAVAAGVNAVAAIQHVKEYQMQKALAGTAFDKARALSQDDPSFFWLAVEIVGVAVDAVAAFKAVSAAARAFKAAEEIGDAKRIADATADLNKATDFAGGGPKLASRVMAQLGDKAGTEAKVLKALEVTSDETKLLEAGTEAAKAELDAGVVGGKVAAELPVKISRSGHIFSCHSPCEWMIAKYSEFLGPDITLEGEAATLKAQYLVLEEEASQAAKAVRTAAPEHLADAEAAAAAVERKIATFDEKLAKEAAYSQATKKFGTLDPEVAAKLLQVEKGAAIKLAGLDAAALERLGRLEAASLNKLASWGLDGAAVERVLAKGANAGHIKGQLLEELLNLKMAQPGALAEHVPAGLIERLEQQGAKLEFIPGHAITDADGRLITDGIIGYWEGDRLKIVTFFEAKGGAPAARGLRYSWTGIPKAERAELFQKAEEIGLEALREDETYQGLAEALSEAASDVKATRKAASKLTLDEVLKQFPNDVKKAWSELPQSEAGQIRKTTERLTEGGGKLRINGNEVQTSTIGGRVPRAVGVLPSGVTEEALEKTLREGGIRNFERLHDIPQTELDAMAKKIAETGAAKPKPNP